MIGWRLVCPSCGRAAHPESRARRCRSCSIPLELRADPQPAARPDPLASTLLERYRTFLPLALPDVTLTLGEGATPLLESATLGPLLGLGRLAFKLEGANPSGSWVDRGTVAQVQRARETGRRRLLVGAHERLALSAARYAARAGLGVTVVAAVEDRDAPDIALAIRAGARLAVVRARRSALAGKLRAAAAAAGLVLVSTADPVWAAGLGTLSFELAEGSPDASPDVVVIAAGAGGEGEALAAGFRAWERAGLPIGTPAVVAVRVGSPSTPEGLIVDGRDAGAAQRLLAESEGIAASRGSAAALAGLSRMARSGQIAPDARVVVVLADERASGHPELEDDPHLVGRIMEDIPLAELARVLALPAF